MRCVPPRLFESRGETDPPFEVRVTVESTPAGCRLTQQEALEVTLNSLDALEPGPTGLQPFRNLLGFLALFPSLRPLGSEFLALQRERLAKRLTAELEAWLNAIRVHVEAGGARAEPTSV